MYKGLSHADGMDAWGSRSLPKAVAGNLVSRQRYGTVVILCWAGGGMFVF